MFGNLKPAEEVMEAVVESVRSMRFNGYAPSTGNSFFFKSINSIILIGRLKWELAQS